MFIFKLQFFINLQLKTNPKLHILPQQCIEWFQQSVLHLLMNVTQSNDLAKWPGHCCVWGRLKIFWVKIFLSEKLYKVSWMQNFWHPVNQKKSSNIPNPEVWIKHETPFKKRSAIKTSQNPLILCLLSCSLRRSRSD